MDLVDRIDKMDFFVLLQKKVKSSIWQINVND